MAPNIRQNFADCKGKIFLSYNGQNIAMNAKDYRERFRTNLLAAMRYHGASTQSLKAPYLAGPKLGDATRENRWQVTPRRCQS